MACNPSPWLVLANKSTEWEKYVVCGFDLFLCGFISEMRLQYGGGMTGLKKEGKVGAAITRKKEDFGAVLVVDC